jgi:hypothetical protein
MSRTLCLMLIVLGLPLIGCGKSPKTSAANVVTTGQATFDMRPAIGAMLLFHSQETSSALPSRAVVGPDGRFGISTALENDGLPEGDYVVTVEWRIGSDENGEQRPSVVPDRYTRKEWSPLQVSVRRRADGTCDLGTIQITR